MKWKRPSLFKTLIIAIIALLIFRLVPALREITLLTTENIIKILFLLIILYYICYFFISNKNNKKLASSILIWLAIFCILIIGYAFRFELETLKTRVLSVLIPSYSWVNSSGELIIARHFNNHFYLTAQTNKNYNIRFLIDTGASDIALTQDDARKLGFNLANMKYTKRYNTANGITMAAPVIIKQLTIGTKTFYNLEAHVTSGELDISLLGMSFIRKFNNFRINRDSLILQY